MSAWQVAGIILLLAGCLFGPLAFAFAIGRTSERAERNPLFARRLVIIMAALYFLSLVRGSFEIIGDIVRGEFQAFKLLGVVVVAFMATGLFKIVIAMSTEKK